MTNSTESSSHLDYGNRTTPIFSIGPQWFEEWRQQKQRERFCKTVYADYSAYTQCIETYNETTYFESLNPDPSDVFNNNTLLNLINISVAPEIYDDDDTARILPPLDQWEQILIATGLVICIIITVLGNILVLMAFIVDRSIRQPSNYFIASLAATDVLIGSVSMPFYMVYILKGRWTLGPLLCDLWLSVDYTVCLVSQYTVLLITVDRFCSVKIPAKYRSWRTKNRVIIMVSTVWLVPALLFFISIFGWEHFIGYRDLMAGECTVQFLKDPVFNTALIIGYYWTTLVILFVLYGGIYKTAYDMQKKSEAKQRKMQSMVALSAGAMSGMAGRAAGIGLAKNATSELAQVHNPVAQTTIAQPKETDSSQKTTTNTTTTSTTIHSNKTATTSFTIEDPSGDKKNLCLPNNQLVTETDKSERSSSPAFESDEDSTATALQQQMRKRSSVVGIVVQIGTAQLFDNNNRVNGGVPNANAGAGAGAADAQTPSSLTKIPEKSPIDSSEPSGSHQSMKPKKHQQKRDNLNEIRKSDVHVTLAVERTVTSLVSDVTEPSSPLGGTSAAGSQTGNQAAVMAAAAIVALNHNKSAETDDSAPKKEKNFVKSLSQKLKRRKKKAGNPFGTFGRQKSKSENRARKAFRTISFILGAFVICWTPYHILALVEGFCAKPPCTNISFFMFCYFLCYANSPLNPFCYALANQQFKKTFTRILQGDLHMT